MAEVARKLREVPRASGKKRADTRFSREPVDFDGSLTAAAGALADLATQLRRKPRRQRKESSETADQFGFDPEFRAKVLPVFSFLYHHYWRVQVIGTRNVPRQGPVLLVANHSGAVPFDAAMISYALEEKCGGRVARFLYDRFVERMPWVPEFYRRVGAVVAGYANAERLLQQGEVVGIFPEGVAGTAKLFSERYVLRPFNSGFVRMSIKFDAPVVPVAVVGAEETYPLLLRIPGLAKVLGAPYLPVTPFFPLLGPLGALPLPTKWRIQFGKPIRFSDLGGRRRQLKPAVQARAERVRHLIQQMVADLLRRRRSVFG